MIVLQDVVLQRGGRNITVNILFEETPAAQ